MSDFNARQMASILNKMLHEPIFRELTRYLDEGDIHELYDSMAEIDSIRHPEDYNGSDPDKMVIQFF